MIASPHLLPRRRLLGWMGLAAAGLKTAANGESERLVDCLDSAGWSKVEVAVDRALEALASNAAANGSLGAGDAPEPAATALVVMAFLSRGHLPGQGGRYGAMLLRAVEFVLSKQGPTGLFAVSVREKGAEYHHAITGLMLCEAYGLCGGGLAQRIHDAIMKAVRVTRIAQAAPKGSASLLGGWRYFRELDDSDLSVSGWHFMFYRSAKNAEFDVPEDWVTAALGFVHSCYSERDGGFAYKPNDNATYSMTAAGLLCLTMVGKHQHPIAQRAANYLLTNSVPNHWRYYGLYYASQAMAQMGGEHWRGFFPKLVDEQLASQSVTGLWADSETHASIVSAWAILSLTPPCQVLPIFQR